MEEHREQAEKLAEERRRAREQALEWTREVKMESDEEREKKAKKAPRRVKTEANGNGSGEEGEPKKKRKGKLRRNAEGGETENVFSGDEEGDTKVAAKKVRSLAKFSR